MSKNLLSNRDLNRLYDVDGIGVEAFLITKRLDIGDEGAAFRALHGFGDDGINTQPWARKFHETRKRRGFDTIEAPDNSVYNAGTPPISAPAAPEEVDPRFQVSSRKMQY